MKMIGHETIGINITNTKKIFFDLVQKKQIISVRLKYNFTIDSTIVEVVKTIWFNGGHSNVHLFQILFLKSGFVV
jgi:hypothetical protein